MTATIYFQNDRYHISRCYDRESQRHWANCGIQIGPSTLSRRIGQRGNEIYPDPDRSLLCPECFGMPAHLAHAVKSIPRLDFTDRPAHKGYSSP